MTIQAQEILDYRGEQYHLYGAPLHPFLEDKKIEFDPYTTAHWRGYQGYWLLMDNKIYLTNIESANHTMKDLFNTEEPVLAEWYSGNLEFGFGERHFNQWRIFYDDYVELSVVNGEVTERRIIKRFGQIPKIKFGKFQGKTLESVINGKLSDNVYTSIRQYLSTIIEFLTTPDFEYGIRLPEIEFSESENKLISKLRKNINRIEYFLTQNYIAVSSKVFWENSDRDDDAEQFSLLLEKIMNLNFSKSNELDHNDNIKKPISEATSMLNPGFGYVNWAIKNVDFFNVNPSFLKRTFYPKWLKSFQTNRLNPTVFEYKPIIEKHEYNFPIDVFAINLEKFELENNVKYNLVEDYFQYDLSEDELKEEFGFFLDESIEPIEDREIYLENLEDYEPSYDDYERDTFNALTDGQYGDYEDWKDNGGDMDTLRDSLGH